MDSDSCGPHEQGAITQTAVVYELVRHGYGVSLPVREFERWDAIVEEDRQLYRVQIKTGRLQNGAIIFNTSSSYAHKSGDRYRQTPSKGYVGDADVFIVFCPDNHGFYWVPVEDVASTHGSLRLETPLHATKNIRWAQDYELASRLHASEKTPKRFLVHITAQWLASFEALKTYAAREGHACPLQRHSEQGIKIGRWVQKQRQSHRLGRLTEEKQEMLSSLPGWKWEGRQPRSVSLTAEKEIA